VNAEGASILVEWEHVFVSAMPFHIDELPRARYAYLLGLYLGDGWLAAMARGSFCLRIALDQRYPEIVSAAMKAVSAVHPTSVVRAWRRKGCFVVSSYWKHWPSVFPQHGPGPKHARPIELTLWQRRITTAEPEALIRGLIHSDGCRFIAAQRVGGKTYRYSRYSFSNKSDDIRAIFCEHLDLLGIGWTRPNASQIAVDRRAEVAKLDAFVGPKR
jgi:hypothetical protein